MRRSGGGWFVVFDDEIPAQGAEGRDHTFQAGGVVRVDESAHCALGKAQAGGKGHVGDTLFLHCGPEDQFGGDQGGDGDQAGPWCWF